MKIFIKKHDFNAGKWIYAGYYQAWKTLGYEPIYYNSLKEIENEKNFLLMTIDSCLNEKNLYILDKAKNVFLYVQPNTFEMPWGSHPNFVCSLDVELINKINIKKNIIKWTFADIKKDSNYFSHWSNVNTLPLAFDNISYNNFLNNDIYSFDVCFIGGRANNGFDEKYNIMLNIFSEFKKTNLKCGFFINKNITHEQEKNILYNSKICLNIHDAYQRKLGLDTNERTFKSLGINGILISDNISQIKYLTNKVYLVNSSEEYVIKCFEILKKDREEIIFLKKENIKDTINNHTYICRAKKMMELMDV